MIAILGLCLVFAGLASITTGQSCSHLQSRPVVRTARANHDRITHSYIITSMFDLFDNYIS